MAKTRISLLDAIAGASITDADSVALVDMDATPTKTYRASVAQLRSAFALPGTDNLVALGSSIKRWADAQLMTATIYGVLTLSPGIVTASTPLINATQTWNAGGVAFTAAILNVTDTASAAGSLLMDLQVGGVSKFSVTKLGALATASFISASGAIQTTGGTIAAGGMWKDATNGLSLAGVTGVTNDFQLQTPAGAAVMSVAHNTTGIAMAGSLSVAGSLVPAAGIAFNGPAALGAAAASVWSYETPNTRFYIGDGTGYALKFSKRTGSVTTDYHTFSDNGTVTLGGALTPTTTATYDLGTAGTRWNSLFLAAGIVAGGSISSGAIAATADNGALTIAPVTGTNRVWTKWTSTQGDLYAGVNGSATQIIAGSTFGAAVFGTGTAIPLQFATNNLVAVTISTTQSTTFAGNLLAGTDASFDFGALGATRFRDGFLSRQLNIGAALTSNFGDALRVRTDSAASGTVESSRFELHHTSGQTGSKYALEVITYGDHSSGTTDTHNAIRATVNLTAAGTITNANALSSNVVVAAGGTITNAIGVNILAPSNSGTITNLTGLAVGNMSAGGTTNFAITTGLGLVQFGDELILAASTATRSGLRFQSGVAPTSPIDGDVWFDGTNYKARISGATKTFTLT